MTKPFTPKPLQLSALLRGATMIWIPMPEQPEVRGEVHGQPAWYWPCKKLHAGYCHTNESAMVALMESVAPFSPGDVIACKETWAQYDQDEEDILHEENTVVFRADNSAWWPVNVNNCDMITASFNPLTESDWKPKWKQARTMPMKFCRMYRTVVSVEARRVQSVTAKECVEAGAQYPVPEKGGGYYLRITGKCPPCDYLPRINVPAGESHTHEQLIRAHFASDFDTMYGPSSWEANLWCWTLTLNRQEP